MKFMLLIYGDDEAAAQATPEQLKEQGDAYEAFTQSIKQSGNYLDGDPFLPTVTAKTVRVVDGETEAAQGPAVTASPQLQAYYKVEADSPEQAVEMASRIPGARYGSIEVRQVLQFD